MKVLVATLMPSYLHAKAIDNIIAKSLVSRGVEVNVLVCNKIIKTCQMTKIGRIEPLSLVGGERMKYCDKCVSSNSDLHSNLWETLELSKYAQDYSYEHNFCNYTVDNLKAYTHRGIKVGEHAHAGALRYLARGDLNNEYGVQVFSLYIEESLKLVDALISLFEKNKYDVCVVNHGIYVPQGILVEVAHKFGIRIVTYNPSYKKQTFIFSHNKSYHYTMLDEKECDWFDYSYTAENDTELTNYLYSRRSGTQDWIWFHNEPINEYKSIMTELGADPAKPIVTALTSVIWDAQLHYKENVFESMLEWIFLTISTWQQKNTDTQLVIRIHPAEIRGLVPSRQMVCDEIKSKFPKLPKNVFIVAPDNEASTYTLCDNSIGVIVYNTKTGAEIGASSTPVYVAGEAWIRNKGIGTDIFSIEQYTNLLLNIENLNITNNIERGRKYAYHFFFRRMIPLPFLDENDKGEFIITDHEYHVPGKYNGLDIICDGIINGKPFIYN